MQAPPEKANEITAIPNLLDHLAAAGQLKGALVTIDAMETQVEIAAKIVSHGADYLLPLKGNQPTLKADVEAYFRTAPASELVRRPIPFARPSPTSNDWPKASWAIRASRACTGSSTSNSGTTYHASGPATEPRTWPSSHASPSASSA